MTTKKRKINTFPIQMELFCPSCGHQGLRKLSNDVAMSGKARYSCTGCKTRTTRPLYQKPQILPRAKITEIKKNKRFIITSAVNNTELLKPCHKTLERIAAELDACYLIIPGVYKNPDMMHQGLLETLYWPEETLPYICDANIKLNDSLIVRGKTRIQYTAINPLAGMNNAAGIESEIYGHPQVAMEMVPTAKWEMPKMLHTTGTISQKNYGGSKTAQKAEFHHVYGALFVEIEGDKFYHTQLNFDGEGIALYDKYYMPDATKIIFELGKIPAVVLGDRHSWYAKPSDDLPIDQMCKLLKPELRVEHDVHDHHIGSHHNAKDTIFLLSKSLKKQWCIRTELMMSVDHFKKHPNVIVVDSNHNRHLDQWYNRFNPHRDPVNTDLYHELAGLLRKDLLNGGDGNLFRIFVESKMDKPPKFIGANDKFVISGIDLSQHGDRGPNGSRGSAKAFSRTGHRTFIGHSHTPRIEKGCWQVGTTSDEHEYASGYSSWCKMHGIIYPNGKRGMFTIIKNKLSPYLRELIRGAK